MLLLGLAVCFQRTYHGYLTRNVSLIFSLLYTIQLSVNQSAPGPVLLRSFQIWIYQQKSHLSQYLLKVNTISSLEGNHWHSWQVSVIVDIFICACISYCNQFNRRQRANKNELIIKHDFASYYHKAMLLSSLLLLSISVTAGKHDDAIKWKHFSRYWPFVWGIKRSPVSSPHKSRWRGALMFYLICSLNKRLNKQS